MDEKINPYYKNSNNKFIAHITARSKYNFELNGDVNKNNDKVECKVFCERLILDVNKAFDWLSEENSYSDWLILNTGCKKTASD